MEDEYSPILIFHFDKEAERSIPLSDEDAERGYLEQGWVLLQAERQRCARTGMIRTIQSLDKTWKVHRGTEGWAVTSAWREHPAIKIRLSEDEVVSAPMRIADLKPGMVYTHANMIGFCVCLPDERVRSLGFAFMWGAVLTDWPLEMEVMVCCTRSPSMQFIFK